MSLLNTTNYIVVNSVRELNKAKTVDICGNIIFDNKNVIKIYERELNKWIEKVYVIDGEYKPTDEETTGFTAYCDFYKYCGKSEIERMKKIFRPINIWEGYEQMHYANFEYANEIIEKDIYVFDANSSFTYGVLQLPSGFEILKEYISMLYDKKSNAKSSLERSIYKNKQNFLIGYFARIKEFIALRSNIINNSNNNINDHIIKILKNKGNVYISNTDSIVTDEIGANIMVDSLGKNAGQFKLEMKAKKLFYKSSNCYQIDNKLVYSGAGYFARKHTDLFKEETAVQEGNIINQKDFLITNNEEYKNICSVSLGEIKVTVANKLGEIIKIRKYKLVI